MRQLARRTQLLAVIACGLAFDVAAKPAADEEAPAKKKRRAREPTHWVIKNDDVHEDRQLDLLANLAVLGSATGGGLAIWVS